MYLMLQHSDQIHYICFLPFSNWTCVSLFLRLHSSTWLGISGTGFNTRRFATAVYAVEPVVVCPSVRPAVRHLSVTSRHCTKPAKRHANNAIRYPSDSSLSVYGAKDLSEIPTGSTPTGAPNRGGVGSNWRFSTNILLYLRNGAR